MKLFCFLLFLRIKLGEQAVCYTLKSIFSKHFALLNFLREEFWFGLGLGRKVGGSQLGRKKDKFERI